jgi:hypothetical protein
MVFLRGRWPLPPGFGLVDAPSISTFAVNIWNRLRTLHACAFNSEFAIGRMP